MTAGMFSQPYDLNIYSAFTRAGVRTETPRYQQGLFYAMYYGTGQWERRKAGQEAVFQLGQLEVVTNITEDTYSPLVSWTVHQVRMSSESGPQLTPQFEVSPARVSRIPAVSRPPTTTGPPDDILNQSQASHPQSLGSRSQAVSLQSALVLLLASTGLTLRGRV